ncbi:MAG: iron uptake porin [Actinomycetota bacterium]
MKRVFLNLLGVSPVILGAVLSAVDVKAAIAEVPVSFPLVSNSLGLQGSSEQQEQGKISAGELAANVPAQQVESSQSLTVPERATATDGGSLSQVTSMSQLGKLWGSALAQQVESSQPLTVPESAIATDDDSLSQVTSVSQLSDVQPTDWAFQALQSLVERYGCIAGYPDQTFRGNRAMTRYEFAAGLNACLDKVQELIGTAVGNLANKDDLIKLQRLQEEFAAELATLRGRVDILEARTTRLESTQFSTTTKLTGDIIFLVADAFGNRANNTSAHDTSDESQAFFAQRTRLDFQTSFKGTDLLSARLISDTIPNLSNTTGTNMTRFGPDSASSESTIALDRLLYRFSTGNAVISIAPKGLAVEEIAPTLNPLTDTAISGAISRFGLRNPTTHRAFDGAGVALTYKFSNQFKAHILYAADATKAANPLRGNGLFDGSYAALAQLTFSPSRQLDFSLTYSHKLYTTNNVNITAGTGSSLANRPFGQNATSTDNFGAGFSWRLSPRFTLGGWFAYTLAHQEKGGDRNATVINGALTLAFPDLLAQGNLGGIIIGVPPKATSNDLVVGGRRQKDRDTSLHIEAFYRYKVNNNVSVTPSFYVITAPEHNSKNDPIWVGVLRTSFTF